MRDDQFECIDGGVDAYKSLPPRSKERYDKEYNLFNDWRVERNLQGVNENIMMGYLQNIGEIYKISSLYPRYSMLKTTLKIYENLDISGFKNVAVYLKNYLKEKSKTHKVTKPKALEKWQIEKFLLEAPDRDYLLMKVVLIIGLSGACRCEELSKLTIDNIEDKGSHLLITLFNQTSKISRRFIVINDGFGLEVLTFYRRYASLRPKNVGHNRFFLNYRKEKCTVQPVGINTLAKVPKEIAAYLNLPDADNYTGHSFRRSSVYLMPQSGEDNFEQIESGTETFESLPEKSKKNYEKEYSVFNNWRTERNQQGVVNEDIMMEYLQGIGEVYKASSLWTRYSMLKTTLKVYENVDIASYKKLAAYLKAKIKTHKAKKAKALEKWQIEKFLIEAPDQQYLLMKVVLIIAISGACRCEELTKLTVDDIVDKGSHLLITLPNPTTNQSRRFIVINDKFGVDVLDMYYRYVSLRPQNVGHNRFFLNYRKEKCTVQPVGINTLSRVPKEIATYLNLPDADIYTGHSFRRTSASFMSQVGGVYG